MKVSLRQLLLIYLSTLLLTSCSYLTDYLLDSDSGTTIDTQLGSNDNKVKTGVGSIGLDEENTLTIKDSNQIRVTNTDDKFHIATTGDTEINVYETNYWLYAIFGLFIIGKPILRTLHRKRQRHNLHEHLNSISTISRSRMDRN